MTEQDSKLAERLDAAHKRSNAFAASAANKAREFVHDHPVASVAGGIVIGALIAGTLTRLRPRKPAELGETVEAAAAATTARLTRLAALGAELALAYATRAASTGKDGIGKIEDRIAGQLDRINENGAQAGRKLSGLAEVALHTLREASEAAVHRLTHRDKE
jgi:hypothetical protein